MNSLLRTAILASPLAALACSSGTSTPGPVFAPGIYVSQSDAQAVDNATCGLGPAGSGNGHVPCKTIGQGLLRAAAAAQNSVFVADGLYPEAVTLTNGISLLGGYRPDTWARHLATTSTIIQGAMTVGAHRVTVMATSITNPTVFEGFVVRGAANTTPNGNSYAIYVSASSANLAIQHNTIQAGSGGPGASGADGANGASGVAGGGRDANPAGYDAFLTGTSGLNLCPSTNNRVTSNGGAATFFGDVVDGGRGGGNTCPPSSNQTQLSAGNGVAGQPATGPGGANGSGGAGGFDGTVEVLGTSEICVIPTSNPLNGGDGTPGSPGANAAAVPGGSNPAGSVVGGHWVGAAGMIGILGSSGGGGGGGGAGGGGYCNACTENRDRLGGLGGGGGSGAQGGGGGGGGRAGGGAFGLFVVGGAAPVVTDNIIERGAAGNGGNGGGAGAGGATGGAGGNGGQAIFCTGAGGKGGNGGAGGQGSGGGGGAGGISAGIYTSGVGTPAYCQPAANNVISGGSPSAGGTGGVSLGNIGGNGVVGTVVDCSFQ